ncbi:MAG: hypothetical protein J7L77_09570 [Clostridiales bacterium]|nr:hypothetical protein [Clostridiales bacterium]
MLVKAIKSYVNLVEGYAVVIVNNGGEIYEFANTSEVRTIVDADIICEAIDIMIREGVKDFRVVPMGAQYVVIDDTIMVITSKIHTVD